MGDNIVSNISNTLGCKDSDIKNVHQIKRGMTNIIFRFECNGKQYVYRHPGKGTEKIINRSNEYAAQKAAEHLGVDPTLVAMDPDKGWKLSTFVENKDFNYASLMDEDRGIEAIRNFHAVDYQLDWDFDMMTRATDMQNMVAADYFDAYAEFAAIREQIVKVHAYAEKDGYKKCMCHNDACDSNILLGNNGTYMIDWEYAGNNDPAIDIATFITGCERTREDVDRILTKYFERELTTKEKAHYYAYIAIAGYFYFSWGIYKESTGQNLGEFTYLWYRFALTYGKAALELYEGMK